MDSADLQKLAKRTRSMREAGFALLFASGLLAIPLVISTLMAKVSPAEPATASIPTAPNAFAAIHLEAKAAIVYDLATGETLYAHNADAQLPLASLTKLLAVYAALRELSPTTPITIPLAARSEEHTSELQSQSNLACRLLLLK